MKNCAVIRIVCVRPDVFRRYSIAKFRDGRCKRIDDIGSSEIFVKFRFITISDLAQSNFIISQWKIYVLTISINSRTKVSFFFVLFSALSTSGEKLYNPLTDGCREILAKMRERNKISWHELPQHIELAACRMSGGFNSITGSFRIW